MSEPQVEPHPPFTQCKAYEKLKILAQDPFDLSQPDALTPERITRYSNEACGLQLLYGTERITDEVIGALQELAEEAQALQKMKKMQAGEVLNFIEGFPSEQRQVLHTSARDLFSSQHLSRAAEEAAAFSKKEHEKLKTFLETIEKEQRFTDLILIGIGGSDLGPKAIHQALERWQKPGRTIHFIANIDPDESAKALQNVPLEKAIVLVTSKSGSTLETLTNEQVVRARFVAAGLPPEKHFVSVTAQGSPLDDHSKYLECFYSWDFVGGRFSVTSMYGAVMLSFAIGYDNFLEFLKGAHAMDEVALEEKFDKNLPLQVALLGIWNRNFLNHATSGLIPYAQALGRFAAHIQQLDMESNGKRIDHQGNEVEFNTGPIIWGEPGTNAQHSFYQLLHQGTTTVPLELIGFKESQYEEDLSFQGTTSQEKLLASLIAQAIALATGQHHNNPNKEFPGNKPTRVILGKRLTPYTMGALLALYEHKVAFQGFIWDINSFDQEGVTLGKEITLRVLDLFAAERDPSKQPENPFPLGEAYVKKL